MQKNTVMTIDEYCVEERKKVIANIQRLCRERKVTGQIIAECLAISPSTVSRYIGKNARESPPLDFIIGVAKVIGVAPEVLFSGQRDLSTIQTVTRRFKNRLSPEAAKEVGYFLRCIADSF